MSDFWKPWADWLPYAPLLMTVCLGLGIVFVYRKQQSNELTWLFTSFSFTLILWSLLRVAMRLAESETDFVVLANFYYAATVIVSAQMLQAILAIQEPANEQTPPFVSLNWVMAIVLSVAFLVTDEGVTGWVQRPWGYEPELGKFTELVWPWQCLMLAGIARHFRRRWLESSPGSSERLRLKALTPMLIFVALGSINFFHDLTGLLMPLSFIFITLFGAAMVVASFRYGLLDTNLSSAIGELSNQLKQGLMVIDAQSIVRYANPSAAELLQRPLKHLRSVRVTELMGRQFQGQWDYIQKRLGTQPNKFDWLYETPSGEIKNLRVSMHVDKVNQNQDMIYIFSLEDRSSQSNKQDSVPTERRDPLTQLMLRETFEEVLASAIGSIRHGRRFEVLLLAIDGYKQLKREHGQLIVDQCVTALVQRVLAHRQSSDVVARLSEDELAIFLPINEAKPRAVAMLAELRASLAAPLNVSELRIDLGISSARTYIENDDVTASVCLKRLIRCLRLAQAAGQDQHFNADSSEYMAAPSVLETELREALKQQQFVVHYQPVLDVRTRRIVAVESLVRWQHPQRGLLFPGDFIEFAEDIGLGAEIDREVMRVALRDMAVLNQQFPYDELKVNFNIGAEQLESSNFVAELISMVRASGLHAREVQLEVLERSVLSKAGASSLQKLSKAGFALAIDDFGTGYSSLARLQDLPVKFLKIDRSFVESIAESSAAAVVRSIIHIARRLELDVVVEGVETPQQLQWFVANRCYNIQGWLFAKAAPLDQIAAWLSASEFPSEHWPEAIEDGVAASLEQGQSTVQ